MKKNRKELKETLMCVLLMIMLLIPSIQGMQITSSRDNRLKVDQRFGTTNYDTTIVNKQDGSNSNIIEERQIFSVTIYVNGQTGNDNNDGYSPESPKKTIQAGIDAAVNGDRVEVAPGIYAGLKNRDLDFNGKAINVYSQSGPLVTIIDCGGSIDPFTPHRGFYFHTNEGRSSNVSGFTIRNGVGDVANNVVAFEPYEINYHREIGVVNEVHVGGGIFCRSASPTIDNCIFENDVVFGYPWKYYGAAVYGSMSSLCIQGCIFRQNNDVYQCSSSLVALFANCNAYAEVKDSYFTDNDGCGRTDLLIGNMTASVSDCRFESVNKGGGVPPFDGCDVFWANTTIQDCSFFNLTIGVYTCVNLGFTIYVEVNRSEFQGCITGLLSNEYQPEKKGSRSSIHHLTNLDVLNSYIFNCGTGINWFIVGDDSIINTTIDGCSFFGIEAFGIDPGYSLQCDRIEISACDVIAILSCGYLALTITNSWIVGNSQGISTVGEYNTLVFTGCTIAGKTALGMSYPDPEGQGRALNMQGSVHNTAIFTNSILWDDADGIYGEVWTDDSSNYVSMSYSDNHSYIVTPGVGNINQDPKFVGFPETTGTWTYGGYMDPRTGITKFYDSSAFWPEHSLKGKHLRPNVDSSNNYREEYLIVDNGYDVDHGSYVAVRGNDFDALGNNEYVGIPYQIFDYHLQWNPSDVTKQSPCVDTGLNSAVVGLHDIDNDPRIIDGKGNGIAVVDMGGDEFTPDIVALYVISSPQQGIWITVSPRDIHGNANDATAFDRSYINGTTVTLTVPADSPSGIKFLRWIVDGISKEKYQQQCIIQLFKDILAEAKYMKIGDANGDGVVNAFDIDPFILALTNPYAYANQYPNWDILSCDINGDGVVNCFDIDPFIHLLTGG